ncbi:MAG: M60 family metallopeptidase, partial [Ruminococcus sp.]|nr:M60 family metallopeptidase [Ruminococcus sp.]
MTSSYTGLTTFAEEFSNQTTGTPSDDNGDSTLKPEVPENTATGVGAVEISFASVLTKAVDVQFTLSSEKTGFNETKEAKNVLVDKTKVRFDNVPAGDYILTATSDKFAVYTQNVDVENNTLSSLSITAGVVKVGGNAIKTGENTEKGTGSIGTMLIGDINNNGIIDDGDKELLISNIENKPESTETDLNGDNRTNLADLELFVDSYECGIITSSVEKCVIIGKNDVSLPGSYLAEGSVMPDAMLRGEGELKLEPENPDEPISEENPVAIAFKVDGSQEIGGMTLATGAGSEVEQGYIDVAYIDEETGKEKEMSVPVGNGSGDEEKEVHYLMNPADVPKESEPTAEIDKNGNIQLNLGRQIAVKKVTITVTSMANKGNIAAISEVKFLNDMENRIPEPDVEIPENLKPVAGDKKFSLTWDPCVNIMGYEVKIECDGKTEIIFADKNTVEVGTFNGKELKNFKTYKVSVQSVNGAWSSGYSEAKEVIPTTTKAPDTPDYVKASGDVGRLNVSWGDTKDAQWYNVFYRPTEQIAVEVEEEVEKEVTEINEETGESIVKTVIETITKTIYKDQEFKQFGGDIYGTSIVINQLENLKEYVVYVKAVNENGASGASNKAKGKTTSTELATMPVYNLINWDSKGKPGSSHIIDVRRYNGTIINGTEDTNTTAWATVDGNSNTYYEGPASNGGWGGPGDNGLTYTFDKEYSFNTIAFTTVTSGVDFTKFRWWDSKGGYYTIGSGYSYYANKKTDAKGRPYYVITLPETIKTNKFQMCIDDYWGSCTNIAEVYFYNDDNGIMDEIMGLYVDDLHTVLRDNVSQKDIDRLRTKIDLPDRFGNYNTINKESLLRELQTAEDILNAKNLSPVVAVHNEITTQDVSVNRGFGGLNAWQPLGVSAGSGEEITVYVGSSKKKTGASTDLSLVFTQYHSESAGVSTFTQKLNVGKNVITLPQGSLAEQENGGALYVQYSGSKTSNEKYSVRVTGATSIPNLDLYKITDENERTKRAVEFVKKLDEYVPTIEALHNEKHSGSKNTNINLDFDEQNCILGASDIMLDTMMYSLPAKQILAGMGSGTVEERAATLLKSLDAMEEMMHLFYQHKGLSNSATNAVDTIPTTHLNIRYQRMFAGAFMYASGNHIGIEWGSAPAMANSNSVVYDENGRYVSGSYFGWGIAHEIGHCINQGTYTVAEITNNYFAQLAQAQDTNEGMRFQYDNVFKKVTSGTKGNCSNIATQLAMYWQLHLAYDNGLNFKTYDNYNEQLANLFYARVDTYSRTPSKAPAPKKIALTLTDNTDQNLMRLACAAANKNVLEFFEHWGKTPNDDTIKYAEQFEKETRAIYFANDDSRIYALNGNGSTLGTKGNVKAVDNVLIEIGDAPNKVNLTFGSTGIAEEDILGYEIERCIITGGEVEVTPVGFSTTGTFTDTISTMNNRTVFYRITLIDQYLNRSETFETEQVKIEHDGSMDKSNWTISVEGFTENEEKIHATEESSSCQPVLTTPEMQAIDFDLKTSYMPHIEDETAEITISFNQVLTTTGLKYTAGEGKA